MKVFTRNIKKIALCLCLTLELLFVGLIIYLNTAEYSIELAGTVVEDGNVYSANITITGKRINDLLGHIEGEICISRTNNSEDKFYKIQDVPQSRLQPPSFREGLLTYLYWDGSRSRVDMGHILFDRFGSELKNFVIRTESYERVVEIYAADENFISTVNSFVIEAPFDLQYARK